MKKSRYWVAALLSLAGSAFAQVAPATVQMTTDPAVKVLVLPNKTDVSKLITVTVNHHDVVTQCTGTPPACKTVYAPPPPFSKVADEGGKFTIAAPAGKGYVVRYGAGTTWIARSLGAGTYTCDNATFTDPLVGTVKQCEQNVAQVTIPTPPPPNVPAPPVVHMHAGVQGIDTTHPILADFGGVGPQPGIDVPLLCNGFQSFTDPSGVPRCGNAFEGDLLSPMPLQPARASIDDWEKSGAIRTTCKPALQANGTPFSYDDPLVYPGQQGVAHAHLFFRPFTDYLLTDANIRAPGNKSTCRGGTVDLTARWVPALYETLTMRALIPHILLMYYKEECSYSIACSGFTTYQTAIPSNVHFVPKNLHLIAGDPAATAPTGVAKWTCMQNSTGHGRDPSVEEQDAIPKCMNDGTESLWHSVKLPDCLAVKADGSPVLDSPNHKDHASYMVGNFHPETPGKQYQCPADHPYQITSIKFLVIYDVIAGLDTTKLNLSCGSQFCGHADWDDGWDHAIMDKTSDACLAMGRDCGTFQVFDGRTAVEFQGN